MAQLTEREKAAIYYHIYSGCNDWQLLRAIAYKGEFDTANGHKSLEALASKWKARKNIKDFVNELKHIKLLKENEIANKIANEILQQKEIERREKERNESEPGNGKRPLIDYSNPQERKKQYNKIIQATDSDPKTQLDALKVFEQLQRDDKQAAKDNQIQRFYTPIKCKQCPLYNKELRKGLQ